MIDPIRKASAVKFGPTQNQFYRGGAFCGMFSYNPSLYQYGNYLNKIICFAIMLNEKIKTRSVICYIN